MYDRNTVGDDIYEPWNVQVNGQKYIVGSRRDSNVVVPYMEMDEDFETVREIIAQKLPHAKECQTPAQMNLLAIQAMYPKSETFSHMLTNEFYIETREIIAVLAAEYPKAFDRTMRPDGTMKKNSHGHIDSKEAMNVFAGLRDAVYDLRKPKIVTGPVLSNTGNVAIHALLRSTRYRDGSSNGSSDSEVYHIYGTSMDYATKPDFIHEVNAITRVVGKNLPDRFPQNITVKLVGFNNLRLGGLCSQREQLDNVAGGILAYDKLASARGNLTPEEYNIEEILDTHGISDSIDPSVNRRRLKKVQQATKALVKDNASVPNLLTRLSGPSGVRTFTPEELLVSEERVYVPEVVQDVPLSKLPELNNRVVMVQAGHPIPAKKSIIY